MSLVYNFLRYSDIFLFLVGVANVSDKDRLLLSYHEWTSERYFSLKSHIKPNFMCIFNLYIEIDKRTVLFSANSDTVKGG